MRATAPLSHRDRITPAQLKVLNERAVWPWLKDALLDWAVMIGAVSLAGIWNNPAGYALAVLVVGNRQHGLALLGHDGTHCTLSHNRALNEFLTNLLAWWPLLLTNGGYRALHTEHHLHLSTDRDPEIVHKKSRAPQWDLPAPLTRILLYAAKDLAGYSIPDFWIIVRFSKPPRKADYLGLAAFHLAANALLLWAGLWWVSALWYGSLVTAFMMFFRLRLWIEHQGSDLAHRLDLKPWEAALLAPHLAWHHWEHHQWPAVPYWKLPALRRLVPGEPLVTLSSLIKFYRACPATPSGHPQRMMSDRKVA
jgi:fatty acid desaturase